MEHLNPPPLIITFVTPEGPLRVIFDPASANTWTIPKGARRIFEIEQDGVTFAPAINR